MAATKTNLKQHCYWLLVLRSLLYTTVVSIITVVHGLLCLVAAPLPLAYRYRLTRLWMLEVMYLAKVICGIRYEIIGQEHLQNLKNAIVFSKHQSAWETIFLAAYFPEAALIIKQELLYLPFFGWGLALLKPIAIKRQQGITALQQLLRQGQKFLQQGRWVIVFPEGTRVAPGDVGRYHSGGAKLAVSSGYPIIPVAHNAGSCWQKRQFLKRPGVIKLVFGPPFYPQHHSTTALLAVAKTWIETTMGTL